MKNGVTRSGIGRRRGASGARKAPFTSVVVVAASFCVTCFVMLIVGYMNFSSPAAPPRPRRRGGETALHDGSDASEEMTSKQFRKWAGILRADLHLVSIETSGMISTSNAAHMEKNNKGGRKYMGVTASFCKLDWDRYKKNPPSLPMFRMLVSESGCDKKKNHVTVDLVTAVQKARDYDKTTEMRQTQNADDVHVLPPSGFVFHESRVGSTLVANSLTAMDPEGHRVYSESTPINEALKACQGVLSTCDMDANADLFQDVVYLMGRTSSPTEKRMFFKVSSVGSKRIDVLRNAFPSVPWIFVYRDPVQTMMSHLDPEKLQTKGMRGGQSAAVCLRSKKHPQEDLIQLVYDYNMEVDELRNEEFCAAHLATLCESAIRQMKKSNGKGVAVEYDNLVDKLMDKVFPDHFGVAVDETARQRILEVSKIYSKSKNGNKNWVEDSKEKDIRSTPEIRAASETFLSGPYEALQKLNIK